MLINTVPVSQSFIRYTVGSQDIYAEVNFAEN